MGEKFHNELLIYTLAVLNTVQFGVYPGVSTYMGKKSFFLPFVTFMTLSTNPTSTTHFLFSENYK